MATLTAYSNGGWIDSVNLSIAVDDIGFLVGATVTDRLRTFRGTVYRLDDHIQRFRRSLEIIGLPADEISGEIGRAIREFPVRNQGFINAADDWAISAFATPGSNAQTQPSVCVHGWPLAFSDWAAIYEQGLAVRISSVRQIPADCWPRELKCRSRMHYYLADQEAMRIEPGSRAILLDHAGNIVESSTANVLVYFANEGLVTPRRENVLPGISLLVVTELARDLDIPLTFRDITPAELSAADEIMLTSSSVCALPVVRCDGRTVGKGTPGQIYRRLLAAWSAIVEVDIVAQAKRFACR